MSSQEHAPLFDGEDAACVSERSIVHTPDHLEGNPDIDKPLSMCLPFLDPRSLGTPLPCKNRHDHLDATTPLHTVARISLPRRDAASSEKK